VSFEHLDHLSGLQVPEDHLLIATDGDQRTVEQLNEVANGAIMACEMLQRLAGFSVSEDDAAVHRASARGQSHRAHLNDATDRVLVADQQVDEDVLFDVPDLEHGIARARGDE